MSLKQLSRQLAGLVPGAPVPPADPADSEPTPGVDDSTASQPHIGGAPELPIAHGVGGYTSPIVNPDSPPLPGAPKHVDLVAPARTLSTQTHTLLKTRLKPLQIAPGSSEPRKVTVIISSTVPGAEQTACRLAPDNRQDLTGARIYTTVEGGGSPVLTFITSDPIYAMSEAVTDSILSVIIEPVFLAQPGGCSCK